MRLSLPMSLLVVLTACTEYQLEGKHKDKGDKVDTSDSTPVDSDTPDSEEESGCGSADVPAIECGTNDTCIEPPVGGFVPIVEWDAGAGKSCNSLPLVVDLTGDGAPEVIVNFTTFLMTPGSLTVLAGDGSGLLWERPDANLAYGSPPAAGDINGDGRPEIIGVRGYNTVPLKVSDYQALCYDADGNLLWESEIFDTFDFDWATSPTISDMDHDGSPEIILGRVILNADGTTRGVGEYGRGSYGTVVIGTMVATEASVSAVSDIDLDGTEEVIVGNAFYDPDGNALWADPDEDDAMIGLVNLDSDPEGEIIGITYNTIRAVDTDGSPIWGPIPIKSGNILATPAIADLDGDGMPEIVTAGGNQLICYNHDGSILWTSNVTDKTGATGASIFDFEGDGIPEVVYIDEVEMIAFDGPTGRRKFYSTEHASKTMFDYPVIADVDSDDHAEIVVCNDGFSSALTVYGDESNSWMPVRKLWNQHAYTIANINDDLSIPIDATPSFVATNTWHSAIATTGEGIGADVEPEVVDLCTKECDDGFVWLTFRVWNISVEDIDPGLKVALYGISADGTTLLALYTTADLIASGWSSDGVRIPLYTTQLKGIESLRLVVDDDGYGNGALLECSESNNVAEISGPFCE